MIGTGLSAKPTADGNKSLIAWPMSAAKPLAHWPTAQPAEVQQVLDALGAIAPEIETREDRTLAEIDRAEADANPVHRLEDRREHLRSIAVLTNVAERAAIEAELTEVGDQLRAARRERQVESTFNRYTTSPWEALRAARITTLAHDLLPTQAPWLLEAVRQLHDEGQLTTEDVPSLAGNLVRQAVAQERATPSESAVVVPATPAARRLR